MASQGPNTCGTAADDATVGTVTWTTVSNAQADDGLWARASGLSSADPTFSSVKLVIGGSVVGSDKSTGATLTGTDTLYSFGGVADLWGTTPTDSDVNAANFGVVVSFTGTTATSHYLKLTNCGFSVPGGATIDGVVVEIEASCGAGSGTGQARVDYARITVHYTEAAGGGSFSPRRQQRRFFRRRG